MCALFSPQWEPSVACPSRDLMYERTLAGWPIVEARQNKECSSVYATLSDILCQMTLSHMEKVLVVSRG